MVDLRSPSQFDVYVFLSFSLTSDRYSLKIRSSGGNRTLSKLSDSYSYSFEDPLEDKGDYYRRQLNKLNDRIKKG